MSTSDHLKAKPKLWAFIMLTAIVLLSYGNSLQNGFTYDDEGLVVHNAFIKEVSDWPKLFSRHYWAGIRDPNVDRQDTSGLYRPLVSFSYALNYAAGGRAPSGYHAVNVLLHLIVVWLVFLLALELGMGTFPSLAAAAIFAAHPIHTEVVAGVVGRAELMMAVGFLGSLLAAARSRRWVSLLFFGLGLGSKEQALMLLPVLVLYDLAVSRIYAGAGPGSGFCSALYRYAPYVGVMAVYMGLRWWALGGAAPPPVVFLTNPLGHLGILERSVAAAQVSGWYLWLSVWPSVLSLDYSYNSIPLAATWLDPRVLLPCATWLALLGLGIASFGRKGAVAFSVGLLFLSFLPVANLVIPIGTIMGERLFYLPSAGLCFLAGIGIQALLEWAEEGRPAAGAGARLIRFGTWSVVVAVCVAFVARTIVRNRDWRDTEHLARAAIEAYPNNAKVHSILGRVAKDRQAWDEALARFRAASRIYPEYTNTDVSLNTNLGIALIQKGFVDEGVKAIEHAAQLDPKWSQTHYNLGLAYKTQRRYRDAEAAYKRAVSLNDHDPQAYTGLSFLYLDTGRYADALQSANFALRRDPTYIEALYTRARALELLNKPGEAADAYQRIVELNPWREGMKRKVEELRRGAR